MVSVTHFFLFIQ